MKYPCVPLTKKKKKDLDKYRISYCSRDSKCILKKNESKMIFHQKRFALSCSNITRDAIANIHGNWKFLHL